MARPKAQEALTKVFAALLDSIDTNKATGEFGHLVLNSEVVYREKNVGIAHHMEMEVVHEGQNYRLILSRKNVPRWKLEYDGDFTPQETGYEEILWQDPESIEDTQTE